MWIVKPDGNAVNDDSGEEIYVDYFKGVANVYRNAKKIAVFTSWPAAKDFIKKTVDQLNGE